MSLPRIVILDYKTARLSDDFATVEREVIGEAAAVETYVCDSDAEFDAPILSADALIAWHNIPITAATMPRLSRCRAIIRNGVGYDSVDGAAAAAHGIALCNVPDYGTEEVADHAIALALALCRQLPALDREAKALRWNITVAPRLRRLRELTFGIVGLGRIGTATALRAKALGFAVRFYDPYLPNGVDKALAIARDRTLGDLLRASDVVSLHCPLTAETHHLIGTRELALLRPTAYLVNTSRGAVASKDAVLAALRAETLAGAGLDVVEDEPLRTAEEAATPNLLCTCHAAFCSVEGMLEMRRTSASIARAAVLGKPLENVVNGVGD